MFAVVHRAALEISGKAAGHIGGDIGGRRGGRRALLLCYRQVRIGDGTVGVGGDEVIDRAQKAISLDETADHIFIGIGEAAILPSLGQTAHTGSCQKTTGITTRIGRRNIFKVKGMAIGCRDAVAARKETGGQEFSNIAVIGALTGCRDRITSLYSRNGAVCQGNFDAFRQRQQVFNFQQFETEDVKLQTACASQFAWPGDGGKTASHIVGRDGRQIGQIDAGILHRRFIFLIAGIGTADAAAEQFAKAAAGIVGGRTDSVASLAAGHSGPLHSERQVTADARHVVEQAGNAGSAQ